MFYSLPRIDVSVKQNNCLKTLNRVSVAQEMLYSWGVNSWGVPMVLSATLFSVPGIIHKNAGSLKGKLGLLFVGDELGRQETCQERRACDFSSH